MGFKCERPGRNKKNTEDNRENEEKKSLHFVITCLLQDKNFLIKIQLLVYFINPQNTCQ
jgi:hypothetical protein